MNKLLSYAGSWASSISWTWYALAGLLIALITVSFLYKKEVEHTGQLEARNTQLQASLKQSEADKKALNEVIANNSQKSLEDATERSELQAKIDTLNKKVSSLPRLTKERPKDAKTPSNPDDFFLSNDLSLLLRQSYCALPSSACTDPVSTTK